MKAVINMHYKGTFYVILKLKLFICLNQALFDIFQRFSINFGEKYYNWTIGNLISTNLYLDTIPSDFKKSWPHTSALLTKWNYFFIRR